MLDSIVRALCVNSSRRSLKPPTAEKPCTDYDVQHDRGHLQYTVQYCIHPLLRTSTPHSCFTADDYSRIFCSTVDFYYYEIVFSWSRYELTNHYNKQRQRMFLGF